MLINILIGLLVIAVLWPMYYYFGGGADRKKMKARIERIKSRKVTMGKSMQDVSLRRKSTDATGIVHWLMKPLPTFKKLADRLEQAGKTIEPERYVFHRLLSAFGVMFVVTIVLQKSVLLGCCLGIILGIWLPFKLLQRTINKRGKAFIRLFPEALDLIVRGLRSGLPVSESMVLVSTELPDPVKSVFENISNTMKLGVPMEKALQETARKLSLSEFNFFTTSIVLQRETGGNLAEILNNLSEVLRARFMMRMKIHAMSSEARASAYIVGALPFCIILLLAVTSPQYMAPLYYDYRGNVWAGIAAFMMVFGMWIMHKMTQFEI